MIVYNVLIFPAGSEIAFEINNALKYSKFVNIYGGSSVKDHSELIYKNYNHNFPYITDAKFIDYINDYIEKNNIDYIYPAMDKVQVFLTNNQDKINAKIVTSDIDTVNTCRSKKKTYERLANEYFVPKTYKSIDEVEEFPIFVKPEVGEGSNGAVKINSKDELEFVLNNGKDMIIVEYLENEEYTVDCFTDRNGVLRVSLLRSRDRIRNGISVRSTRKEVNSEVEKIANIINSYFKFNGAWFFQLKKNKKGEFKLLEISPRVPGTMGLSRNIGVNFCLLTLFNMLGYDLDIIKNSYNIIVDRAFISRYIIDIDYDNVYIDFDDVITNRGKINLDVIRYLYQCVNKNKEIYLLTRHKNDIYNSLKKYKLSEDIFTQIINIDDNKLKSDYIKRDKSIFIDDSFRERIDVYEKLKIPVFDIDMIECLIDWRN